MDLKSRMADLMRYYDQRAPEYEALYYRDDPVRLEELDRAADTMKKRLAGRRVLEIACGTGFWTEKLAGFARSVLATDTSQEMLSVARQKNLAGEVVNYELADAYDLANLKGEFDAGVANFWLSHVPKSMLSTFLDSFHTRLGPGAIVFMIDNYSVPGYGGEFIRVAESDDTFRRRQLSDGSSHEIIKNYYDETELEQMLLPHSRAFEVESGKYYWWLSYTVA